MDLPLELNDLLELRHQARSIGIAARRPVNHVLCGLYRTLFKGQGMDFDAVRQYQLGDEIRHMDWRVTARTGAPHLKVFQEERQRNLWRLLRSLSQDSNRLPATTPLPQVLDQLNRIAPTAAPIVIIADFNQDIEPLTPSLGKLAQSHQILLIPIDDPADKKIPSMGKVQFIDLQGKRLDIDSNDRAGQAAYHALWQQRRQHLVALAKRLGQPLLAISTHDDTRRKLLYGLRQLQR